MFAGVHGAVWNMKHNRTPEACPENIKKQKLELDLQFGNEIQKREAERGLLLLKQEKNNKKIKKIHDEKKEIMSKYRILLLKIIRNKKIILEYINSIQFYIDTEKNIQDIAVIAKIAKNQEARCTSLDQTKLTNEEKKIILKKINEKSKCVDELMIEKYNKKHYFCC
jgi:hypothetical protein